MRERVLEVVKEEALDLLPELKWDEVDRSRSLKDYGASSLDLVELVSSCMRTLKVKIPRADLTKINSVDALVDALCNAEKKS
jgi:acyl carrier protein